MKRTLGIAAGVLLVAGCSAPVKYTVDDYYFRQQGLTAQMGEFRDATSLKDMTALRAEISRRLEAQGIRVVKPDDPARPRVIVGVEVALEAALQDVTEGGRHEGVMTPQGDGRRDTYDTPAGGSYVRRVSVTLRLMDAESRGYPLLSRSTFSASPGNEDDIAEKLLEPMEEARGR